MLLCDDGKAGIIDWTGSIRDLKKNNSVKRQNRGDEEAILVRTHRDRF